MFWGLLAGIEVSGDALKSVHMTREYCVYMQSKLVLYVGMKEKSYFREKLAWKRGSFSLPDELGICKH